jgi:hypothetical protein
VAPLVHVEPQGVGERRQDLGRGVDVTALFEPRVPADPHVGELRDLLAAQARDPAPGRPPAEADRGRIEPGAPRPQELGQHLPAGLSAIGGHGHHSPRSSPSPRRPGWWSHTQVPTALEQALCQAEADPMTTHTDTEIDAETRDAIAAELLRLKNGAIQATRDSDVAYYDAYAADDAIGIFPWGTFDKAAVLAQVAQPQPPFQSLGIEDEQVMVLTEDCGVVRYTALYPSRRVAVSTLFLRRNDRWQAVVYQQTVLDPRN